MSVGEVALRLGLSSGRVTAALEDAGISRRRPVWTDGTPPDPITSEQLHELYVENGGTVREVAAALETTTTRVNAALRRHGIPRRPEPQSPPPPLELDRNTLTELYVTRRLDDEAIGAMHQVPAYRVTMRRRQLDVHRPQVAPPHPEPPAMPPAPVLHDWYVTQKRTLEQIARHHHTTRDTVRDWLHNPDLPSLMSRCWRLVGSTSSTADHRRSSVSDSPRCWPISTGAKTEFYRNVSHESRTSLIGGALSPRAAASVNETRNCRAPHLTYRTLNVQYVHTRSGNTCSPTRSEVWSLLGVDVGTHCHYSHTAHGLVASSDSPRVVDRLRRRVAAMTTTPQQTPSGPSSPRRHTVILLAILFAVAIPLVAVAIIWPTYGAGCAITVALLISLLQAIYDNHHHRK